MPERDLQMRDEDILEIRQYWREGVRLNFPEKPTPSTIENENLYNASWQDLSEEEMLGLRKYPFRLNGVWRRIYLAGWQQFINGMTVLHLEKNGEDINLASGRLVMGKTSASRKVETMEACGPIPIGELHKVAFALAVGENFSEPEESGLEHLALYTLANVRPPVPQLAIAENYFHQVISLGEVWALVVKHERVNLS